MFAVCGCHCDFDSSPFAFVRDEVCVARREIANGGFVSPWALGVRVYSLGVD